MPVNAVCDRRATVSWICWLLMVDGRDDKSGLLGSRIWEAVHMSDSQSEVDQLTAELQSIDAEIDREVARLSSHWTIDFGRFKLSVTGAKTITLIYMVFNSTLFTLGVVFTFLRGVFANLGVALIVGAIFSFSTLIAQVWSVSVQNASNIVAQAFGNIRNRRLENLGDRYTELAHRVDELRKDDRGTGR